MRLEGKVALISGGARGMGAEEGRLFAKEGAKVVLGDVLEAEGKSTVEEIRAAGGEATFVRLDVTNESDWAGAVTEAERHFPARRADLLHRALALRLQDIAEHDLRAFLREQAPCFGAHPPRAPADQRDLPLESHVLLPGSRLRTTRRSFPSRRRCSSAARGSARRAGGSAPVPPGKRGPSDTARCRESRSARCTASP